MNLAQALLLQRVKVESFSTELDVHMTLLELGILPGDILQVTAKAIAGGPIAFKHDLHNFFALRKEQAELIQVSKITEQK
ncbi:MAG: ferrous iron transport protein A [Bacteriovoracaceae bacterium]|nr:ferrous iron transport protein A [Bacteriovoracaceae bacterium]